MNPNIAPELQMLQLASGHIAAQAVHIFATLGIADILRDEPKRAEEIARLTESDPTVLYRVLRFLGNINVVAEDDDSHFRLTLLGKTLCSHPSSVIRDNVLFVGSHYYWASVGAMLHTVKTGGNAFQHAHGREFFSYLEGNPTEAGTYNAFMSTSSKAGFHAILSSYDFSTLGHIVDVAGGRGDLIMAILKKHPSARGTLLDAASVLETAVIDPALAGRLTKSSGNFFESIPSGADAYVLRRILHDWDDAKAVEILCQCRKAAAKDGKLIVIELAPPDSQSVRNDWAMIDLVMMLLHNGRERTAQDFERIFSLAGFRLVRTIRTRSAYWIVEAVPV